MGGKKREFDFLNSGGISGFHIFKVNLESHGCFTVEGWLRNDALKLWEPSVVDVFDLPEHKGYLSVYFLGVLVAGMNQCLFIIVVG